MAPYPVTTILRAEAPTPRETLRPAVFDLNALALPTWMLSFSVSLILSRGIQPALRGAFVGAGRYIPTADHAADLTAQVTGILTSLLLIHLGLRVPRLVRSVALGVTTIVLTMLVVLPLYTAHRLVLPSWATGMVTLVAGLIGGLLSLSACGQRHLRMTLALTGVALASSGLELVFAQGTSPLQEFVLGLRLLSSVLALGWLTGSRLPRAQPLREAAVLGSALLLYLLGRSASADISPWMALVSRTTAELMTGAGTLAFLQWGWCWAFLAFMTDLAHPRSCSSSIRHPLLPLLLLLALSHPAPLVAGAFALGTLTLLSVRSGE